MKEAPDIISHENLMHIAASASASYDAHFDFIDYNGLVKQCERHAAKCRCKSKEASSLPELAAANADVNNYYERVGELMKWTLSNKEWPPRTHF